MTFWQRRRKVLVLIFSFSRKDTNNWQKIQHQLIRNKSTFRSQVNGKIYPNHKRTNITKKHFRIWIEENLLKRKEIKEFKNTIKKLRNFKKNLKKKNKRFWRSMDCITLKKLKIKRGRSKERLKEKPKERKELNRRRNWMRKKRNKRMNSLKLKSRRRLRRRSKRLNKRKNNLQPRLKRNQRPPQKLQRKPQLLPRSSKLQHQRPSVFKRLPKWNQQRRNKKRVRRKQQRKRAQKKRKQKNKWRKKSKRKIKKMSKKKLKKRKEEPNLFLPEEGEMIVWVIYAFYLHLFNW